MLAFDPEAIEVADKLVQGARVYVQGRLELSEWTGADGVKRQGLNVMSWHCRLPHWAQQTEEKAEEDQAPTPKKHEHTMDDLNDSIPF